jgi:hypothetical protein
VRGCAEGCFPRRVRRHYNRRPVSLQFCCRRRWALHFWVWYCRGHVLAARVVHVMLDQVIIVVEGWATHPGTSAATTTATTLMVEMWRMVVRQGRSYVEWQWLWLCRSRAVQARIRHSAAAAAAAGAVSQKVKAAVPVIHAGSRVMVQCSSACAAVSVIICKRNA